MVCPPLSRPRPFWAFKVNMEGSYRFVLGDGTVAEVTLLTRTASSPSLTCYPPLTPSPPTSTNSSASLRNSGIRATPSSDKGTTLTSLLRLKLTF
ncbi:hypothetical protein Pcinc_038159 [Petrolisthes cinctipes]|uniref:Uncharacterized protein n=1 Tax=Petrolisthes cinctipes TaxID=88211 RepID=A0AAE1ELV4_PETCI|nr:hypothetical protein Pcinc_038159 [Petrolisthes cinctipes]